MPFMVLKKEIFRGVFRTVSKLFDGSFLQKSKYDGLAFLKELIYFKTHRLKMLEF